ncbi:MAG: (Fe-S)-binding protein [Desulfobacteraceae bacterium]|nr:(Fe-S)-binding protein [Desulfobacteraceae bacterium]
MQLTKQQVNYCMECGVCTGSCPISQELPDFSPRQMIKKTIDQPEGEILHSSDLWACLTCSRCSDRCPVEIDFPEFIRSYRIKAIKAENLPRLSHNGMLQSISAIQAQRSNKGTQQNRTAWAEEVGKFSDKGEYFYFVGCLPYFDVIFQYLNVPSLESAKNILKILNKIGIEPVISNNECCCGHDAYWSGDEALFQKLAEQNIEAIKASGAKKILFNCPEGYNIFKEVYTEYFGKLDFEIIHVADFLLQKLSESDTESFEFNPCSNNSVTYQDPCRLGRRSGIYEEPRKLINLVPKTSLKEMEHNRENAICCGTTAWMECSNCSKVMQVKRLKEAKQAGADTIITACPKCQIHLTCATTTFDTEIKIIDLYSYLAESMNIK